MSPMFFNNSKKILILSVFTFRLVFSKNDFKLRVQEINYNDVAKAYHSVHDSVVITAKDRPTGLQLKFELYNDNPPKTKINATLYTSKDPFSFIVYPFEMMPSWNLVEVSGIQQGKNSIIVPQNRCVVAIEGVTPVVKITGSPLILADANRALTLYSNESFNPYKIWQPNLGDELEWYVWNCTQAKATFCTTEGSVSTRSTFTIPAQYMQIGEEFEVFLYAASEQFPATKKSPQIGSTQTSVRVVQNRTKLTINCMSNCPPISSLSDLDHFTYLTVTCNENCLGLQPKDILWTISTVPPDSKFQFDYAKNTRFGRTGYKFVIIRKGLDKNGTYSIRVELDPDIKDRVASASIQLSFANRPQVTNCKLIPDFGYTIETKFGLHCEQSLLQVYSYELYCGDQLMLQELTPQVFARDFLLPASKGRQFRLKISGLNGGTVVVPLKAVVIPRPKRKPHDVKHEVNDMFQQMKNDSDAVNKLITLADALQSVNDTAWKEEMTSKIVHTLNDMPIQDIQTVIQLADMLDALVLNSTSKIKDLLLVEALSEACMKLAKTFLKQVHKESAVMRDGESYRLSTILGRCHRIAFTEDQANVLKPFEVTTKEATFTGEMPKEDYEDYQDLDQRYHETIKEMQTITSNILTSSLLTAKFLAMTSIMGDGQKNSTNQNASIAITKDTGDNLAKSSVQCGGVVIIPSEDFKGHNHSFDILVSVWKNDFTWWNSKHTYVATEIVNVQFWHSTCKKRLWRFEKPAHLLLNVTENGLFKYKSDNVTLNIPKKISQLHGSNLNPFLKVRRLTLQSGRTCRLIFDGLAKEDALTIAWVLMRYPSGNDFQNTTHINATHNFVQYRNSKRYDVWAYAAILPENTTKKREISFNISAVMMFCVKWDNSSWQFACKTILTNRTKHARIMECACNSFSVLAGYVQNIENIPQDLEHLDIEITIQAHFMIFVTVLVILLLYSLLIISVLLFNPKNNFYFLADNNPEHRYAYLLRVRTGNSRNSGTTSHITIRLHGTLSTTPPHVLNFPDPEHRLLQKGNEDIFILTNETYLGHIEKLQLWFDCWGPSPSWYCKEIVVYDMQLHKTSLFPVEKRFSLVIGIMRMYARPLGEKAELSFTTKMRPFDRFHTWLCLKEYQSFGLVKRLTVILSTVLAIGALVLIWMDVVDMELTDIFDEYHYHIEVQHIWIAAFTSVIVFTIHISITWLFRFSKVQYSAAAQVVPIPFACTVLCWTLLSVLITMSISYLLIFGFWVPTFLGWIWLTTSAIALAINIILLENVVLILRKFLNRRRKSKGYEKRFASILREIETQRTFLYRHISEIDLLKPYLQQLYIPLRGNAFKAKEIVSRLRARIVNELEDLFMFSIYIIILYMVFLHNKGFNSLQATLGMKELLDGVHTRSFGFTGISDRVNVYQFMNETLIKALQSSEWYEGYVQNEAGLMQDHANKYLGIVRLRQHRLIKNPCTIPEQMSFLRILKCRPEFHTAYEDKSAHGYHWGPVLEEMKHDRMNYIWNYSDIDESDTLPANAEFATYPDGGYIAYLGRTLYNSYANFRVLQDKQWIDSDTRSLFIEFLTYNANNNGFNGVRLAVEMSATGYIHTFIRVVPVKMLYVDNEFERTSMILFFLFVIWVFLLFFKQTTGFVVKFRTFYKDFWFLLDLSIIFMSVACIALTTVRTKMVGDYLKKVEHSRHNTFISYFALFSVEHALTICAAFLVTTATVRLWRLLRWAEVFRVLERTMLMAAYPLLAATLAFANVLFAFGMTGILLYGNDFKEMHSLVNIIRTLITMSLKPDQFSLMDFMAYTTSYIYFSVYLVVMQIMMFLFIVILIMSFLKAKLEASSEIVYYNVQEYFREQARLLPKLARAKLIRLRGGGRILQQQELEDILEGRHRKVYAKADEFRYAGCVPVPKSGMNAMRFITKCMVRNLRQTVKEKESFSEKDVALMIGVCRTIISKKLQEDQVELFYKGHFEKQRHVTLVDERKIVAMARIAEVILGAPVQKPEEKRKSIGFNTSLRVYKKTKQTMARCDAQLSIMEYRFTEFSHMLDGSEEEYRFWRRVTRYSIK